MKSYKLENHKYANMQIIENDLSHKKIGEYKTYTLISYTTAILTVCPTSKMVVLGNSLYSMTTRKHVSWFIDWAHKMGILPKEITYKDIKKAIEDSHLDILYF